MRTVTRLMLTRHMLLSSQRAYEQEKKESDDQSLRTSDVRGSLFKVPGMQQRRDCNRKIRGKKKKKREKKKRGKKKDKEHRGSEVSLSKSDSIRSGGSTLGRGVASFRFPVDRVDHERVVALSISMRTNVAKYSRRRDTIIFP